MSGPMRLEICGLKVASRGAPSVQLSTKMSEPYVCLSAAVKQEAASEGAEHKQCNLAEAVAGGNEAPQQQEKRDGSTSL